MNNSFLQFSGDSAFYHYPLNEFLLLKKNERMKQVLLILFLLSGVLGAFAQERQISGKVTDNEGEGIPGANIILKGTTVGTTSDLDGNYRLSVPDNAEILVFSFIGMKTDEVSIGARAIIDLAMSSDVQQLAEVVVTALGVSREKRSLGYSITQVDNEDLSQGTSSNFTSALSGKLAGVQVTGGTGQPGSSTNVVLRGYANVGRATQPLYVIDGVPVTNTNQSFNTNGADVNRTVDFGNGINDLNSGDIESMSVLRGSAATALYGSAGANGVIMITTKKGSKGVDGKPKITIGSSTIFSSVLRVPSYQKSFGQGWDGHYASEENGSWGPRFTNDSRLWGNPVNGSQLYKDFSFLEDQVTDFYEIGAMFDNSISISNGDENGTYYVSFNNVTSDGIVPRDNDSFNKNSFKFGATRKMGLLNVSTSFNYINKEIKAIPTGQGQGGVSNLFDDILGHPTDISIADMDNYKDPNSFQNPNNYFSPYLYNPYFTIDNTSNVANIDRMIASVTLNADIYKDYDIKGTFRFGGDVQNTFGHNYDGKYTLDDNSINKGSQSDVDGYYREFQRNVRLYNMDAFLSGGYNVSKVSFNLTAGMNMQHNSEVRSEDEVKGLVLEQSFPNLANTASIPTVNAGYPERVFRRQSIYSILDVNFDDIFYISGSFRNTWSSTLPQGNNSFFYPSVNASLILSDAIGVLKDNGWMDYMKLRVGYGQSGNDADPYVVNPVFVQGGVTGGIPFSDLTFPLAGVTGYEYSNVLGNPNLKPEISTDLELGVDVVLFSNRLSLDVTYYDRTTEGMILARTLASSSGFNSIWDNVGKMTNNGIEISANLTPIRNLGGFTWDIGYKFDKNNNKVVDLTEGLDEVTITGFTSPSVVAIKGKTVSHAKAFGTQTTDDGRIIVDSQTGRPLATPQGVDLGSTLFDYTMGLSNTLRFKDLTVFFQFDYRQGGKFISYSKQQTTWTGKDPVTTYNDRLPFVVPNSVYVDSEGNYMENTIPISKTDINNYYTGDWNDQNIVLTKTFVKLREVNVTYNLPKSLFSNMFVESASISLVGSNLWLRTPASNNVVDPEITTASNGSTSEFGEIRGYPSVRNYGFKINVIL
ncbi:MAG: TonB-linked SusC/RagA family outer membrane protein [Cyclobacteriaceae bacterium]